MTKKIEAAERGIAVPPHIVDDLTRREFLIGSAGLLLLPAGCGGDGGNGGEATSGETRTIEHAFGEVEGNLANKWLTSACNPPCK